VRRRGRSRPVVLTLALAGGAVLLLAVVLGLAFAGPQHELAAGTEIAGVDVGGLSERTAVAKLDRRFRTIEATPVSFSAAGSSFAYAADQLGVQPNWRAAVAAAANESGGFGPIRGFRRLHTRFFGGEVVPSVAVSDAALEYALDQIASKVDQRPRSAALERHGLRIETERERLGRSLDRAAASELVVRELAALDRSSGAVALPVRTVTPPVTAVMLAPAARRARVAVSAPVVLRSATRSWRLPRRRIASLLALPSGGATRLQIAGPRADAYFRLLSSRVGRRPVNAHFATSGESISVVPAQQGIELDVPLTARALLRAATSHTDRVARLAVATANPFRSTADVLALGIDRRMSTYKTYNAGTADRITNLRLGVEALDDTLVRPGGTFSLNRAIGERTAARGFKPAPVIIGTEYAEEVGGGTSQVATTTFNAAWEAGLDITERNPHALYISRYPLGRDATVYWPTLDLKFRNDTKHWVLVKGYAEPDGIRVSIYGGEKRRVVSSPGTMQVTGPVPVKRVKDPTLAKGTRIVQSEGQPPSATSVTRTVYDASGKVLHHETWNTSYKAEDEVVLVGTKPPAKPAGKDEKPPPGTTTTGTTTTGTTTTGTTTTPGGATPPTRP
jgi:vancomycin resistance protein YoaR